MGSASCVRCQLDGRVLDDAIGGTHDEGKRFAVIVNLIMVNPLEAQKEAAYLASMNGLVPLM